MAPSTEIAREKAGIIKPGAHAILAGQPVEAAQVLLERCAEMGALPQREGIDFGVIDRQLAVGGQVIRVNGAEGPVDDIFLPLHGAHQAANAAQALAAVEAFLGLKAVNPEVVREGFADVRFPGRMEVVRRSPTVVLDAAHNPHGARAAAAAITEAFGFTPLIGVVAVMADKDARGLLTVFEEVMNQVVVTQVASTSRGMPAPELGELAAEIFGAERVNVAPRLDDALELAISLAETDERRCSRSPGHRVGGCRGRGADAAGHRRRAAGPSGDRRSGRRLGRRLRERRRAGPRALVMTLTPGNPMRVVLLSILLFEVVVYGLAIPVMILVSDVPAGYAIGFGGGAALLALVAAALLRRPAGYLVGWVTQPVGVVLGFLTAPMFFVGAMFLALWVISFILGKRLDGQTAAAA